MDTDAPKDVVLYGGSFNPPHLGHALMIQLALSVTGAPVWVIPTSLHAFGKELLPFETRMELCRIAFRHWKNDNWLWNNVSVLGLEQRLAAKKDPVPSYTYNLVKHLMGVYPDTRFTWLMGVDTYDEIDQWYMATELRMMVKFLVAGRGNKDSPQAGMPAVPSISSSEVRESLKIETGLVAARMLDKQVLEYIRERGLYK